VDALVAILRSVSIVCVGLLCGGAMLELALLIPLLRRLGPATGTDALRFLTPRALKFQPVFGFVSAWTGTGVLIAWPWTTLRPWSAGLTIAGALSIFAGAAVTLWLYLPADRRLRRLDSASPAAEYTHWLGRMELWNGARLVAFVAGFVCYVEAAVFS
jgi:uncharacterized membrane protein